MKPEDLVNSFSFIVGSLVDWAIAIRHPVQTALKIIDGTADTPEAFRSATKLWLSAYLISLILQIPLYQLNGIAWSNLGFHLCTGFIMLLYLVIVNLSIYGGFKVCKTAVSFKDLYVFYTVFVAIFSPLFTILGYPIVLQMLGKLKTLKASGHGITAIASEFFKSIQPGHSSPVIESYQAFLSPLIILISIGMLACVVHFLSKRSEIPEFRIINALAFGVFVIGLLPTAILSALYYFALYAFL